MASLRRIRRNSCIGKQRHKNQIEAVKHCIALQMQKGAKGISAYRCGFCKGWGGMSGITDRASFG
jgi:hypothetical protein